jgi:hypothetical protein
MPTDARAQRELSANEQQIANYTFATWLGSGIYDVGGRTVQVYRIPFSWTLRDEADRRIGVRLTFPLTLSFVDFATRDVLAGELRRSRHASLAPGVSSACRWGAQHVALRPGRLHVADRTGEADAWIFAMGLRTLTSFRPEGFEVDFGTALVFARTDPGGKLEADHLTLLEASTEARHGVGLAPRGHELDVGAFLTADLGFGDTLFPLLAEKQDLSYSFEAGITFGARAPVKIWKIPLPRIGFGYRFGPNVSVYRIVLGIPAPSLRR